MKKVLNILSIISLITIGASNIVGCSNKEIKEQKISFNHNIKTINGSFSNENRLYFGTKNGSFVLKQGSTIPTKIGGISDSVNAKLLLIVIIMFILVLTMVSLF